MAEKNARTAVEGLEENPHEESSVAARMNAVKFRKLPNKRWGFIDYLGGWLWDGAGGNWIDEDDR